MLVVGDEPLLRLRAADMIEDTGFVVAEVRNADEAVAILEARADIPDRVHRHRHAGRDGRDHARGNDPAALVAGRDHRHVEPSEALSALWVACRHRLMSFERMDGHTSLADLERRLAAAEAALREKSQVETALRRSEELRRIAVEGGRMGTWRWSLRDEHIWGDAAFLELWGFPPSQAPRRLPDFTDRMSPQGRAEMGEMITRAVAADEEFDGQLAIVSGPTEGRWVRWRGRAERERPWLVNGVSFDVTAQRRADERLRASEERYRAFVTASSDAVYRMSPDWLEMHQLDGRGFLADTGGPNENWIDTYILPEDHSHVLAAIAAAIRDKRRFELEHRVRRADGSLGWTLSRAVPIFAKNGAIVEWLGSAHDVTGRKRAEAALRESEERQAFLLGLSDALRQLEEPSEIQQVSCRLLRQQIGAMRVAWGEMLPDGVTCVAMGEDMAEGVYSLAGRTWDWNQFDPAGLAALKRGETIFREDVQSAHDLAPELKATFATYGFQAFINVPLVNQGRLEAFLLAHWPTPRRFTPTEIAWMEETTERTAASVQRAQAKVALQESEARLAAGFESVPAGIGVVSTDGAIIIANEHLRRYLPSDAIPSRDPSVLPRWRACDEQGRPLRPDEFPGARALRGERVVPGQEMLFTQADGQEIWTQVASVPIRDAAGRVTAAATVISDIDELKRTSQALQAGEERQAFLLKLSDALRPLTDALKIQETATRLLGEHLDVRAVNYGLVEAVDGVDYYVIDRAYVAPGRRSSLGRWPVTDFPGFTVAMRAGETMAVDEVASAPNLMPRDKAGLALTDTAAFLMAPLVKNERPTAMLCVVEDKPRAWTTVETALVQEVAERTWAAVERARAEAALRDSEARFQQFAKASAAGLWIRSADTLAMEFVSPAIATIYGVAPDALLGDVKRWAAMIVPEDREAALKHLDAARAGDAAVHEFRIQRPSDGVFRWIRNTDFPLRDDGHIPRIGGIAEDVTETRRLATHQGVLLAELQHRVRNIMGMIRSMANRTAAGAVLIEDYRSLLEGRLLALARVQALLTREANAGGSLRRIIETEVAAQAHRSDQSTLTGPDVNLSPKAVEVLTLAFHELATNALKYGAFSVPDGHLTINWTSIEKRGSPWLALDWIEEGAPLREPSKRRGFGSELIEARIPYELGGSGKITLASGGARCRLEFPLKDGESILETDAPQPTTIFGGILDMAGTSDLTGRTVLVVEDDYYMAHDTAAALRGAGATVLGPCPTLDATRDLLGAETPTHAVLDLNLGGGGPQFEIAHLLKARGVPFVFLTGYDPDVIPKDMEDVIRLQKPMPFRSIVEAVAQLQVSPVVG